MKLAGALLALFGSLLAGRQYASGRRRELAGLDSLCAALTVMESELSLRASPLTVLIPLLARESGEPAAAFFSLLADGMGALGERSFRELWQESAFRSLSALREPELRAVLDLGTALGRYALEQQTEAIRHCRSLLASRKEVAGSRLGDDLRLSWGLSASLGILLWLLCS